MLIYLGVERQGLSLPFLRVQGNSLHFRRGLLRPQCPVQSRVFLPEDGDRASGNSKEVLQAPLPLEASYCGAPAQEGLLRRDALCPFILSFDTLS